MEILEKKCPKPNCNGTVRPHAIINSFPVNNNQEAINYKCSECNWEPKTSKELNELDGI